MPPSSSQSVQCPSLYALLVYVAVGAVVVVERVERVLHAHHDVRPDLRAPTDTRRTRPCQREAVDLTVALCLSLSLTFAAPEAPSTETPGEASTEPQTHLCGNLL